MLNILVMRAKISKTAEPPSAASCERRRVPAASGRSDEGKGCPPEAESPKPPRATKPKKPLRKGATKARAARRRRKARSRPERRSRKRHSVGAKQRKEKIFSFFWGRGRGCLLLIVWGVLVAGLFWAVLRG